MYCYYVTSILPFCRVWLEVEYQLTLFLSIKLRVVEREDCVPVVQQDCQQLQRLRPALVYTRDGQTTELTCMLGTRYAALGCAMEESGVGDL